MIIRKLEKEDDFTDLIALSRGFFEEYVNFDNEYFGIDVLRDEDIIDYFHGSLDSNDSAVFVAVNSGRIIGYVTVYLQSQPPFLLIKRIGVISGLMVHERCRRSGVAGKLLAEARSFFENCGVNCFTVYTSAVNRAAIALYKHNGMSPLYVTFLGRIKRLNADS